MEPRPGNPPRVVQVVRVCPGGVLVTLAAPLASPFGSFLRNSLEIDHAAAPSQPRQAQTAAPAPLPAAEGGGLNYAAVLDTAADIARAMLHLHSQQARPSGGVGEGGMVGRGCWVTV